jgi:hypothetical protein
MGRSVVEATKAWRIRRTRGDSGRLRLAAAGCVVPDLLAADLLAAGLFACAASVVLPATVEVFFCAGLCVVEAEVEARAG